MAWNGIGACPFVPVMCRLSPAIAILSCTTASISHPPMLECSWGQPSSVKQQLVLVQIAKCICSNCKMNLSKLQNEFVQISKCISLVFKMYLSMLECSGVKQQRIVQFELQGACKLQPTNSWLRLLCSHAGQRLVTPPGSASGQPGWVCSSMAL